MYISMAVLRLGGSAADLKSSGTEVATAPATAFHISHEALRVVNNSAQLLLALCTAKTTRSSVSRLCDINEASDVDVLYVSMSAPALTG
jgi:hypothetical protein